MDARNKVLRRFSVHPWHLSGNQDGYFQTETLLNPTILIKIEAIPVFLLANKPEFFND